jgi:uncharacterized protein involved in exopolysaccharide biosynthesis
MAASYEQDRIEAVRDNPVITVVDAPIRPAKPDSRGLAKGLLIGIVLGGMLAVLGAYLAETWAKRRRERERGVFDSTPRMYEPTAVA